MLQAKRVGAFSSSYAITLDGQPVTRWDKSMWRTGGSFTVQGQRYEVSGGFWGTSFTMIDQSGTTVATAANPRPTQAVDSGGSWPAPGATSSGGVAGGGRSTIWS